MILKIALVVLIIWVTLKVIKFLAKRIFLIFLIVFILYGVTQANEIKHINNNIELIKK